MTAYMSQADTILSWLRIKPEGITAMEAMRHIGCMRLAARIAELRERGYEINTVNETSDGKTWARYQLVWPKPVPEGEQRALWGDR